jgi:hypothetical protein
VGDEGHVRGVGGVILRRLKRHIVGSGLQNRHATLGPDNAPHTRPRARALETFRIHNVHVVTSPLYMAHVIPPIDVSWA